MDTRQIRVQSIVYAWVIGVHRLRRRATAMKLNTALADHIHGILDQIEASLLTQGVRDVSKSNCSDTWYRTHLRCPSCASHRRHRGVVACHATEPYETFGRIDASRWSDGPTRPVILIFTRDSSAPVPKSISQVRMRRSVFRIAGTSHMRAICPAQRLRIFLSGRVCRLPDNRARLLAYPIAGLRPRL